MIAWIKQAWDGAVFHWNTLWAPPPWLTRPISPPPPSNRAPGVFTSEEVAAFIQDWNAPPVTPLPTRPMDPPGYWRHCGPAGEQEWVPGVDAMREKWLQAWRGTWASSGVAGNAIKTEFLTDGRARTTLYGANGTTTVILESP